MNNSENYVFRVFLDGRFLPKVEKAHGAYIYTSGGKFLDLTSGGTSYSILGWNDPDINKAVIEQLEKFGHIDYKIWNDTNVSALAELLVKENSFGLTRCYFSGNSGAEACEAAMKMSFQAHQQMGKTQKKWFISRKQSYHGSTSDALVLGDRPNLDFYKPMLSPYRRQIQMHHFNALRKNGETEYEYADRCVQELEDMICDIGPENVCGFVGETIMGGLVGDVPPVGDYWKKIKELCTKYDIHLILDEVYCGTGTSGKYFCFEYDNVRPDFVFMGKTLAAGYGALSVVMTTEEIFEQIAGSIDSRLQHTTTHQAHSLSLAAALAVQQKIKVSHFLNSVKRKGEIFRESFRELLGENSQIIDIRGRGMRFSIEHSVPCKIKNSLVAILRESCERSTAFLLTQSGIEYVLRHLLF